MKNKTVLKYHSYLGLFSGIFLVILGISGAILSFNKEINHQIFKKYNANISEEKVHLDKAVQTIQKNYPKWEVRIVDFKPGAAILFNLRLPTERKFVFVNPVNGKIIDDINANTHFTQWLLKLHYSLHAGAIGKLIILIFGIAFLLSIITGIYLYRKVFIKTLLCRIKIRKKNKRQFYSVLHRYIGVWALFFNLVLVITGIVLSYGVAKVGFTERPAPNTPYISGSLENSLQKIEKEYPYFKPTYIRLPKQTDGVIAVNGKFDSDPFFLSEFYNKIEIDYKTGDLLKIKKVQEASFSRKLNSIVTPLHYGTYGNIFVKMLYCLTGLSGPFLSITGFIIWRNRRKSKIRKKK